MSSPFAQIELREATALIARLRLNVEKMPAHMQSVANIMLGAVDDNFEAQGRPSRWAELAESTKARRTKTGNWPGKTLQVSGQLRNSISAKSDARSAEVGTNLVYAAIHNFGGMAGLGRKVKIAGRPFLWLEPGDIEEVLQYLRDQVADGV
jgi:phage virion morphogenesis protein